MAPPVIEVARPLQGLPAAPPAAAHPQGALRQRRSEATEIIEVQHALRDIDFDVAPGEFFGIVGRNGSGKSTLLKILAGIYQPDGRPHAASDGRLVPFIELGVGFNPELTGRENVYLNGALLGFSQGEVDAMYDDIVAFAELEESMDQKLKNYSSGMQVRIAFSVATRAQRRHPADRRGARGRRRGLPAQVLRALPRAQEERHDDRLRHPRHEQRARVLRPRDPASRTRGWSPRAAPKPIAEQYLKLFAAAAAVRRRAQPQPDDRRTSPQDREQAQSGGTGASRTFPSSAGARATSSTRSVRVPPDVVERPCGGRVIELEAVARRGVSRPVLRLHDRQLRRHAGPRHQLQPQEDPQCGDLAGGGATCSIRWRRAQRLQRRRALLSCSPIIDRQGVIVVRLVATTAASFSVRKDEKTPYIVTPDAAFSIERFGE